VQAGSPRVLIPKFGFQFEALEFLTVDEAVPLSKLNTFLPIVRTKQTVEANDWHTAQGGFERALKYCLLHKSPNQFSSFIEKNLILV
jgi:hypothetical protein